MREISAQATPSRKKTCSDPLALNRLGGEPDSRSDRRVGFFLLCGKKEGMGHFYRAYTLCQLLSPLGIAPLFHLPPYPPALAKLRKAKIPWVHSLEKLPPLRLSIVDLLDTPRSFAQKIRKASQAQLHFDDLGRGAALADWNILTLRGNWENRVYGNSPQILEGPRYLLLHPAYRKKRKRTLAKSSTKLWVHFGGSDARDFYRSYAPLFHQLPYELLSPHSQKNFSELTPEKLAPLASQCDLALVTLGLAFFECLALGLPTLTLAANAHQVRRGKEAQALGLTRYLGKEVSETRLKKEIERLAEDFLLRQELSQKGKQLIDGWGEKRILKLLSPLFS